MSYSEQRTGHVPFRRRYLVHLICTYAEDNGQCCYLTRIRPWVARASVPMESRERLFADEDELIRTINPLLPRGSDIRHVLSNIGTEEGFLYLLRLSLKEAELLGWHGTPDDAGRAK